MLLAGFVHLFDVSAEVLELRDHHLAGQRLIDEVDVVHDHSEKEWRGRGP